MASSALGGKRNVKIFLLYLMQNVRIPLDFATLNDMVMQTDYVMYLDMAEAFHELLDDALIEVSDASEEPQRYVVTSKGRIVAEQLHSELLPTILDESLRCALRYLDFRRRGITTHCSVTPMPSRVLTSSSCRSAGGRGVASPPNCSGQTGISVCRSNSRSASG